MESVNVKLISFDLDGTLTTQDFVDAVWRVGVPKHYAAKHGGKLAEARELIAHLYDCMGDDELNWYDLPFWVKYLKLDVPAEQIIAEHENLIALFPDVTATLSILQQRHDLIIISNANRMFLDREVARTGIEKYFKKIFSATSDFGRVKREEDIYRMVCERMNVTPAEIIHIGDHREFDFEAPQRIGIRSWFLDRSQKETGPQVIHSLDELPAIIYR
jgi:putative hydrolase of the HAD superfamily